MNLFSSTDSLPKFALVLILYGTAFALSFIFAWYFTPLMRRAALEIGIVDKPDGRLKTHETAVPYLGGLAVYMSFLVTVGLITDFGQETLGLLLSGSIMIMVGLIDDFGVLNPWQKLLGQTVAAAVLIKSGTFIKLEVLPETLALVLTFLWILAVTNALNIIDIMDGLAAGVAGIAAFSIAIANFAAGRVSISILCVVLAGACFGFLRHNFHPARIYLGDAGSLFIGFMLAALSLNAGYTRVNFLAVISPVLILGVPLFDLFLVMFIRRRKGMPVMKGSPDHFALRLRRCKLSVRETAVVSYVLAILLGSVALLLGQITFEWAALTLTCTLTLGFVFAYLLMKVDMTA